MLGLAQTGTGKTAAFALPILERLSTRRAQNPRALILAPTRELALQIHAEIELLARYTKLRAITIFGGVSATPQLRALRRRPDILVACPGRLLDLLGSGDVCLDGIEVLVLDEADHMLDMGFLRDIKRVLARLPARRQNLLFSATMSAEIRTLTKQVLRNPHLAELAHSAPAETIEHALYLVDPQRKAALLRHLLGGEDFKSAIVFLRTKHRTRRLAKELDAAGHRAIALQGNMSQGQRQRAMQGFRDGDYDVLVATDIAARGIDVAQVSHVINFDVPNTPDAYTHRIGRTGRAERSGQAFTFVTAEDRAAIRDIERKIRMKIQRIKLDEFCQEPQDGPDARPEDARAAQGSRGRRPRGAGKAGRGRTGRAGARETGREGTGSRAGGRSRGRGQVARRSEQSASADPAKRAESRGKSSRADASVGFGAGLDEPRTKRESAAQTTKNQGSRRTSSKSRPKARQRRGRATQRD